MGLSVLQVLFVLLFPAFAQWLSTKSKWLEIVSPIVMCYGVGILLANIPGLPIQGKINEWVMNISVPLAIALLLLSAEIRSWLTHSRELLISFLLALIAVILGIGAVSWFYRDLEHVSDVGAMLAGVYSGSTPNLMAVGYALESPSGLVALTNTSDMFTCVFYLLALLSFLPALLRRFLPKFSESSSSGDKQYRDDYAVYYDWISKQRLLSHTKAFLYAIGIFGSIAIFSQLIFHDLKPAFIIVGVSSLAIAASFIPSIRKQKASYYSGQYLLMVFCTAMGMNANFRELMHNAGPVLIYTAWALSSTLIIHFLLSKIFRIDADTTIVTSTATIFGPPFIGQICNKLKNPALIAPGMIMGVMGIIVGNYFGLFIAWMIRLYAR